MLKKKQKYSLQFFFSVIALLLLSNCQTTSKPNNTNTYQILNSAVSVNYSSNGRLWRLIPTKKAVFVDYSTDNGITFHPPVKINTAEQKISAWPENPPSIKISPSGRVNVLYYADEQQKSTSFFSYSDDNGKTFSSPELISDHAKTAMHYMDKMLIDKQDNTYLFWHDTRHNHGDNDQSVGTLSLYYSKKTAANHSPFINQFLSSGVCSCCRTAITFDANNKLVVLVRMVYPNGVRDHALIHMNKDNTWQKPQRITHDNWHVEACPEHGPAIAIDKNNRTHLTWFTSGETRNGIFYAQTDDFGMNISNPMLLGNSDYLPSHPDVIAVNKKVVIVWKEFDGEKTTIQVKESLDEGLSWVEKGAVLQAQSKNGHPKLISNQSDVFLSWTSVDKGHQFIKL